MLAKRMADVAERDHAQNLIVVIGHHGKREAPTPHGLRKPPGGFREGKVRMHGEHEHAMHFQELGDLHDCFPLFFSSGFFCSGPESGAGAPPGARI